MPVTGILNRKLFSLYYKTELMSYLDPIREITWKYLLVEDIRKLSEVNRKMLEIWDDPDTWRYLLKRDYNVNVETDNFKELYMYNSKYEHSNIFRISLYDNECDETDFFTQNTLKPRIRKRIVSNLKKKGLRRGDIVHITDYGEYRNEGRFICDGSTLVDLAYEPDEYCNIPSSFTIGDEFKALHWKDTIDHNSYVWIDLHKYGDQILKTVEDEEDTAWFDSKLGRYFIYFNPEKKMEFIDEVENKNVLIVQYSCPEEENIDDRGEYDDIVYWIHME